MTILVTGATGQVGRLVVRGLVGAGADVRALTRDPAAATGVPDGVKLLAGDLSRPDSIRDALAGVERMYLFPVTETASEVVALAKEAGVRRIVVLSSAAAADGSDTTFHLPVERAVEESGLEWTHVRPGEFMANKIHLWGPSVRERRVVRHPGPDDVWLPVHEQDIADVAVTALLEDGRVGAAHVLHGPEPISLREQVGAIAAAIGEEVRMERNTREEARAEYIAQGGFAAEAADLLLGFTDYEGNPLDPAEDSGEGGFDLSAFGLLPSLNDAIGRPGRTFAEWARDHADDFR
ncbi:SDR family oxidoreductase [Streptomyces sp. NPDC051018]|uniref:SDR family oxidoreductase n=1 Tax=Streptomyces sp. NPDC051018 TaxID=3365639 RepID=UPI0037AD2E34